VLTATRDDNRGTIAGSMTTARPFVFPTPRRDLGQRRRRPTGGNGHDWSRHSRRPMLPTSPPDHLRSSAGPNGFRGAGEAALANAGSLHHVPRAAPPGSMGPWLGPALLLSGPGRISGYKMASVTYQKGRRETRA
jgi:hypothetical protein